MKRIFIFLFASLVAFASCDKADNEDSKEGTNQSGNASASENLKEKILGTWVDYTINATDTVVIKSDGTLAWGSETYSYSLKGDTLRFNSKITFLSVDGDIMEWENEDQPIINNNHWIVWFKENGTFSNRPSGRYDFIMGEDIEDTASVFIFNDNKLDVYIIAWGQHLSGTYSYEKGILSFTITSGERLNGSTDPGSYSWAAGGMDPETLSGRGGYHWENMDVDDDTKNEWKNRMFVVNSDGMVFASFVGLDLVGYKHE